LDAAKVGENVRSTSGFFWGFAFGCVLVFWAHCLNHTQLPKAMRPKHKNTKTHTHPCAIPPACYTFGRLKAPFTVKYNQMSERF